MDGLLCSAESLNIDQVKILVSGSWYKQVNVRVACSTYSYAFFGGGGGGAKSISFSLFRNRKSIN